MKNLNKSLLCLTLAIILAGGSTAYAISPGQGLGESNNEVLSNITDYAEYGEAFRSPHSIVALPDGSVLVSDSKNHLIRKIANGVVETYGGITLENDDYGMPQGGWSDGDKDLAVFSSPTGITADAEGNVYIADADNNLIRKISSDGKVTTVAGDGFIGNQDGVAGTARFNYPQDVAIANDGTIYVADTLNHVIRKISVHGDVSTLNAPSTRTVEVMAGLAEFAGDYLDGDIHLAKFNEPSGLVIDNKGNLYISDTGNQLIRYIDFSANTVTTVGGNLEQSSFISDSNVLYTTGGHSDGDALKASFNFPKGLAITEENGILIADSLNHTIRYLLNGQVTTLAGDPNLLHNPTDVAVQEDGSILVTDSYNNTIRKFNTYEMVMKHLPQNNPVRVVVNSEVIQLDATPEAVGGRTMIPIRSFAKTMGYSLEYDNKDNTVLIGEGQTTIKLNISKPTITVAKSGSEEIQKRLDTAPFIKDSRAYVPLRALTEAFGYDVQWDNNSRTVMIQAAGLNLHSPLREAEIEKVTGIVHIQKAGGSKIFRAYEGFVLHHGDHIKTETHSSVVFKVSDVEDQVTVDENSMLYISDLRSEGSQNITRFYIWSGSVWANVSTLANSEDIFEVETPTTAMGVRGTVLLVGVDPATGESRFYIASGVGQVSRNGDSNSSGIVLRPNEQITLDDDTPSDDMAVYTNIADLDSLISNTSQSIIEAIIANKAAIDAENAEYIASLQQDNQDGETNQETINRINQNLENLVGNIINAAIRQGKVDEKEITDFINTINEQMDKKLDLDNVKPLELSEVEKAKQAQIKLLEEERKKKQEEAKQRQEQLKKQNEELLKKLEAQLEKQKLEKEKAAEAAKKKAAEEYAKKLANDAARAAFEAKQKALEEEKARQEAFVVAKNAESEPARTTPRRDRNRDDSPTPPSLTLIHPTDVLFSNERNQSFTVRAAKDVLVELYGNGDILDTKTGNGLEEDITLEATELDEGVYNFTITARDDVTGKVTTVTVPTITIDTTPPVFTEEFVYSPILSTFTITGGELGSTIKLIELFEGDPPEKIILDSIELDDNGNVTFDVPLLPDGNHIIVIKAIDAAGNFEYGIPHEMYVPGDDL